MYALVRKGSNCKHILELDNVNIINFEFEKLDLLENILPNNIDLLYHLAWVGVDTNLKNYEEMQLKNIDYSLKMLKLADKLKVKKIIYPGSVSEYAYNDKLLSGFDVPSPTDFYSASKVAVHYICDLYARQHNLNFVWALISSVYGPGREDNNLITYTIKSLLNSEVPSFTKLEQRWDYIYIEDLIDALYKIGESYNCSNIYPIGSGEDRTLFEYVEIIRNIINRNLKLGIGKLPYKSNRIDNSIVDIERLEKDTGFRALYPFEIGIEITIEYFKQKMGDID